MSAKHNDAATEVDKVMIDIREKRHICGMCKKNNGRCELKDPFQRDFKARSCRSFEKKGGYN